LLGSKAQTKDKQEEQQQKIERIKGENSTRKREKRGKEKLKL